MMNFEKKHVNMLQHLYQLMKNKKLIYKVIIVLHKLEVDLLLKIFWKQDIYRIQCNWDKVNLNQRGKIMLVVIQQIDYFLQAIQQHRMIVNYFFDTCIANSTNKECIEKTCEDSLLQTDCFMNVLSNQACVWIEKCYQKQFDFASKATTHQECQIYKQSFKINNNIIDNLLVMLFIINVEIRVVPLHCFDSPDSQLFYTDQESSIYQSNQKCSDDKMIRDQDNVIKLYKIKQQKMIVKWIIDKCYSIQYSISQPCSMLKGSKYMYQKFNDGCTNTDSANSLTPCFLVQQLKIGSQLTFRDCQQLDIQYSVKIDGT
ncbi:unnamed protein product [Paramecium sonneborni]|uniref:Uncharacterized protein n=1 Tax=Paramecium sonneborni TaxID=65129 RepID=A0A8S1RA07_9CILI|nr:unnamed protein product [Paramecium sonneborni]CAD8123741.1 unnamed protein product [Paramecium sonneborni]